MVHRHRWRPMVILGSSLWTFSVWASAFAGPSFAGNYVALLLARMVSGVSEAILQCIAPPLIQKTGGKHAGVWLALYYTAIPAGTAGGYVFGSVVANAEGMDFDTAFAFEGAVGFLLLACCCYIDDDRLPKLSDGGAPAESPSVSTDDETPDLSAPLAPTDSFGASNVVRKRVFVARELHPEDGPEDAALIDPGTPRRRAPLTFREEISTCLSSQIFVLIVFSYSVYTGVIIAISTFGSSFVLALGILDTEKKASVTFGLIASAAGIIGTPLGGAYIDRVKARHSGHTEEDDRQRLAAILEAVRRMILMGTLLTWPISVVRRPSLFMSFFFLGMSFLFASTSGMNIAIMLSVEPRLIPNAIALCTFMIHLFGDVPSPIVVGLLKDWLAPSCIGENVTSDACKEERGGIRDTLIYIFLWMTWSIVLLWYAKRAVLKGEPNTKETRTGRGNGTDGAVLPLNETGII
uniref:Major facilitator superfamily (MFS) profile domain-containing protein n=1 Tax=Corethron hystrix TaxID=216773 RepID=A0A7S1BV83_9STRA